MYITSGISIRNDVYYNHMDTRYSMNYRVRIADEKARMPILQGFPGFLYAVWLYFGSIRKILFQTEWRIEPLDVLFFATGI